MKILIDGCGYIGKVHLNSSVKYGLCDAAICEIDEERLRQTAEEFGITETYTSLDEALANPFDGVVICTPNAVHQSDMEKCMKAGLNVMVEKPVSHTLESAQAMCKTAEECGKFAFVAYCLRFAPAYRKIRELVREGALGKVFGIRAGVAGKKAITDAKTDYRTKRSMGGGVISDFSHEIDYALWFAGAKVIRTESARGNVIHKDWDVEDTAELILVCEQDITISVHMDFLQPYFGRSIEIYGTEGAIRWRDDEEIKLYRQQTGEWVRLEAAIDWELVYRDEMIYYLECLAGNRRPEVDEKWGCEIMRIVDSCK